MISLITNQLPLYLLALCFCVRGVHLSSKSDYHVSQLKQFGSEDELYSGYMPIKLHTNYEGSLFFWLAKQRNKLDAESNTDRKLVIWLNGGPGCSSMTGMMWENGPFTIHNGEEEGDFRLERNPYSWNEIADVLFVDQPIRAGYSVAAQGARRIRTERDVAQDFHSFLLSFIEVFTEYQYVPLYITGESYAGAYIPWMAEYIVHLQQQQPQAIHRINLQGVAIGNGVIDYAVQVPTYAEYAYFHGLIPLGAKLKFDRDWINCIQQMEAKGAPLTRSSFASCDLMHAVMRAAGGPNEYDTRTFLSYSAIMQPDGAYSRFFNDPRIQEILHVSGSAVPGVNFVPESGDIAHPKSWVVCNNDINSDMNVDSPVTTVPALQYLLAHIRVLLYSGESDLNCNTLGTLHTLEANSWGDSPWSEANRGLWKFNGDVGGEYFNVGNAFGFLIVRNSGHLLPMDRPDAALELLRRFLADESFADVVLPTEASYMLTSAAPIAPLRAVAHSADASELPQPDWTLTGGYFCLFVVLATVFRYCTRTPRPPGSKVVMWQPTGKSFKNPSLSLSLHSLPPPVPTSKLTASDGPSYESIDRYDAGRDAGGHA